ncbi:MAG: glutamate racemase [Clostridiales bacterium]|nr:MAG: glutamate racemase [Clostridiales bacterium]
MIGVFDSGIGGLSVLASLSQVMKNEDFYYIGDSINAPYGVKTKEEICSFSRNILDKFVKEGARAVVIACNTATSACAESLRQEYSIPIFGLEPAVNLAAKQYKYGRILVLATDYTINSQRYKALVERVASDFPVDSLGAPELVDIVESGKIEESEVRLTLKKIIDNKEIYTKVVLGCTHFIFLKKYIEEFFGPDVDILDGNNGTAEHVKNVLKKNNLLKESGAGSVTIENTLSEEKTRECINIYNKYKLDMYVDWSKVKNIVDNNFDDEVDRTILYMMYSLDGFTNSSMSEISKALSIKKKDVLVRSKKLKRKLYNELKKHYNLEHIFGEK